jgi:hypothetical protein
MGSTLKKTKINKNTFSMGGGSLADKVANNSRKITLIKNVISTGKSDLGSKLASLDGRSSPESDLTEINETLNDIGNALALDFANRIAIEKGENKRLKTDASKQKNKRAENRIENALIGGLSGMVAPIAKQGQKVADAMSLLALSAVGNAVFERLKGNNSNSGSDGKDKPGMLSNIKKNLALSGKNIVNFTKDRINNLKDFGTALTKSPMGSIFGTNQAVVQSITELKENQVQQLEKENFNKGEATVLVNAITPRGISENSDGSLKTIVPSGLITTNTPGDVGGNAFGGLVIQKMISDKNLRLEKQQGKVTEITLPIEKLVYGAKQEKGASGETTVVPYVTSVNVANEHMTETPEIHGIILD